MDAGSVREPVRADGTLDARPPAVLLVLVTAAVAAVLAWAIGMRAMVNDEGIWLYAGRIWADHGAVPYVDAVENKTPGIFEVCAAVHRWFGTSALPLRAIGAVHVVVGALLAGRIARRLHDGAAGLATTLVAGLAAASPALDGSYASATESFVMAWGALALVLVLEGEDGCEEGNPRRAAVFAFLAGVALGVAAGFKQVGLAGAGTVAAWIWLRGAAASPGTRAARILLAAAGTVAGTLLVALPVLASAPFAAYADGAWGILLDAGTRPEGDGLRARLVNLVLAWDHPMPLLVAGAAACALLRSRVASGRTGVLCLAAWILFDGLGTHASGQYYGHQWKQWVPSLAAATGIALSAAAGAAAGPAARPRRALGILAVAGLLAFPWRLPADAAGGTNRRAGARDTELAAWIASHTAPDDRVVLVSRVMNPVLAQCGRRAATRWLNTLFLGRAGARDEIAAAFASAPPRLVVIDARADPGEVRFFESLLGGRYEAPQSVLGCRVFLRR